MTASNDCMKAENVPEKIKRLEVNMSMANLLLQNTSTAKETTLLDCSYSFVGASFMFKAFKRYLRNSSILTTIKFKIS